eukprot:5336818-Pyramimonas_sp.AAC.1
MSDQQEMLGRRLTHRVSALFQEDGDLYEPGLASLTAGKQRAKPTQKATGKDDDEDHVGGENPASSGVDGNGGGPPTKKKNTANPA